MGLFTGVYSQLTEPIIHMKIYAPRGIIRNGSTIYTSKENGVEMVMTDWNKRTQILWYGKYGWVWNKFIRTIVPPKHKLQVFDWWQARQLEKITNYNKRAKDIE